MSTSVTNVLKLVYNVYVKMLWYQLPIKIGRVKGNLLVLKVTY